MDDDILKTMLIFLVPMLFIVPKAIGLYAKMRRRDEPGETRMGKTLLGRIGGPLPGDIALIAQIGSRAVGQDSAGAQVLRTTPGLRLISVGISAAIVLTLLSGAYGGMGLPVDSAALFWGLVIFLGIGVMDILTYELRVDRDGMVLTRFIFWRRSFDWVHLLGIDDDQNYQYVLAFARGGRVKVLKHLVGMPHFLTVVMGALSRNEARNAGTARG
ncbi:MAG: hypothetical protein ACRC6I_17895 [Paracoccaceae bacterium]